jgi:uncharacterized membrane protein YebE (DUF533 family)
MNEARSAMSTWVGTLARGGILHSAAEEAGVAIAAYVVGEERLSELRQWLAAQPPEVVQREQGAAIGVCIWMAQADRNLDPAERALLEELVNHSGLDYAAQERLIASIESPPAASDLASHAMHPVLRELLLALAWELAMADGRIDQAEQDFYVELGARLDIDPERAREIRDALSQEIPPDAR